MLQKWFSWALQPISYLKILFTELKFSDFSLEFIKCNFNLVFVQQKIFLIKTVQTDSLTMFSIFCLQHLKHTTYLWKKLMFILTLCVRGADLPTLTRIPKFLNFALTNPCWDWLTLHVSPLWSFYKKFEHPLCIGSILVALFSTKSWISE